jgi:CrcB protein
MKLVIQCLAVATGFVGAYTTFSTLMYESSELIRDGEQIKALVNLVGSFALGMVAVWVGMALARRV